MAKVLDDFTIKRTGRSGEEIDWDAYLDGRVHELKEGSDFKSKLMTFKQKASRAAKERGGKLETRTSPDKKVVQIRFSKDGKK